MLWRVLIWTGKDWKVSQCSWYEKNDAALAAHRGNQQLSGVECFVVSEQRVKEFILS